jgi:transposase
LGTWQDENSDAFVPEMLVGLMEKGGRPMKTYSAGLDVGSTVCELAVIDDEGIDRHAVTFPTSERNLIVQVSEIRRRFRGKLELALEEGEMAQWITSILRSEVDRLVVADPKRNAWIARDPGKADRVDARKLARLLRGGFVREIYHPIEEDRAEFKRVVQQYNQLTRTQARFRNSIKSKYRAHGVVLRGTSTFSEEGRQKGLCLVTSVPGRQILLQLYKLLDAARLAQGEARNLMVEVGRSYPEVARFQEVPGIGAVWACTFSGYIQTPHRFSTKRKLWRFSGLSIKNRSSNGKPLG